MNFCTTFGLSLRAGRRRVSHTIASQAWLCLLALWATPLTKNSPPDCFHLANPTSTLVGLITRLLHILVFCTKKATLLGGLWLRRLDLNQRPSGYEPDELPGCSTPRYRCKIIISRRLVADNQKIKISHFVTQLCYSRQEYSMLLSLGCT